MPPRIRLTSAAVALLGLLFEFSLAAPHAAEPETVGNFTAVQGQVQMSRAGTGQPVSVKLADTVASKAMIETLDSSRAKALFLDESMLAIGEYSKIQVQEQTYDPRRGKRSMVFHLLEGKARALVTKTFPGAGSRFEIRTSSAVAATQAGYFVVWIEQGAGARGVPNSHANQNLSAGNEGGPSVLPNREFTGIANIGDTGSIDFTSSGQTVSVRPGHFAYASTGQPPSAPMPLTKGIPLQVSQAIRDTSVVNAPKPETPYETLRAMAGSTIPRP